MRKKILAGNWKMNTTIEEGTSLYQEVQKGWNEIGSQDLICIIAPPSTHIFQLASATNEHLFLAAQNCSEFAAGAHTGDLSAQIIGSAGAIYIIIGHSERRAHHGESNQILQQKVNLTLQADLYPIYCCGESETDRDEGVQNQIVLDQLKEGLFHLTADDFGKVVVAYEPVWAIGTGKTASPAQAQDMHAFIRKSVEEHYGEEAALNLSILYGGSCNPSNADELFAKADIDGGLIGGASLKAKDFIAIANSLKA